MIETTCLSKRYGALLALDEVSLRVEAGEILGFLGPNGAGKSTTLRILSGFMPPTSGSASIDGLDLLRESLKARQRIGYLPENFVAPQEMRVVEYLRFRGRLKGLSRRAARQRVTEIGERLGLGERMRQTFGALSKGFRQRVGLADALLADPPALLLDEPFGGLDPLQRQEFRDFLRDLAKVGKAVLFSSHVLPEVEEIADRVAILHQGRLQVDGTIEELGKRAHEEAPVQFRTEGDPVVLEQLLAQDLLPEEASSLKREGPFLTVLPASAERRQFLFRWLAAQEQEISEYRTLAPTLDDLFRSSTA